jgi:hypothetical protein
LRIALSEGQVGWMPYFLERLDRSWRQHRGNAATVNGLQHPPSTYVPGRVFGCVFDDLCGLENRHKIGVDQIMFEVDYPHGDSTWPHTTDRIRELAAAAKLTDEELRKVVRENAIRCYGLERLGVVP